MVPSFNCRWLSECFSFKRWNTLSPRIRTGHLRRHSPSAQVAFSFAKLESRILLSSYIVDTLVDDINNTGSLRYAINQANSNSGADTIQFAAGLTGTITLTNGQLELTDTSGATTIEGLGAGQLTISGNNSSRVFEIKDDVTVVLNGLKITDGYFGNNNGGGIYNKGTLTINDSVISGNRTQTDGGGIWSDGNLTINSSTISDNSADGYYSSQGGGGIVSQGTLTITNSTITKNKSYYGAGGGGITNIGALTITSSTITDNYTSGGGGGLYNLDGVGTLINVTMSGNTAVWGGGGIANVTSAFQDASLTLINCTISGNTGVVGQSDEGAGGIDNAATLVMYNTIVANSINSNDIGNYGDMSGDRNLVENGDTDGLTNTITGIDPMLDTLENNGGPTMTMGLLGGSLAINGGDNSYAVNTNGTPLANDQRGAGFNRVMAGRVDIGAFELQNATITVTIPDDDGYGSLRDAINLANTNPGEDAIAFSSSLAGKTIVLTSGELALTDLSGKTTITGLGASQISVSGNKTNRIFNINGNVTVEISGLTIENGFNYSVGGGGIINYGHLTISDSILTGNLANYGSGGAIQNENAATLSVINSTFSNNTASYDGGAIVSDGTATITGSTFIGNSADSGGAISASSQNSSGNQKVTLINSTLSNNIAYNGGAIFTYQNGTVVLTNNTLSGNSTYGRNGGGGINNFGSLTLNNNIIANSSKGGDLTNNGTMSGRNNLIEDGDTNGLSNTITGQDPLLGSLQNNGGITQTFSLQSTSAAINAGNNDLAVDSNGNPLTTDQRGSGYARILNGQVDLGAFESNYTAANSTAALNTRTGELVITGRGSTSYSTIGIRGEADGVVSVWIDNTGDGELDVMLGLYRNVKSITVNLGDGEDVLYVAGHLKLKKGLTVNGGADADSVFFVHGDGSSEGFFAFQTPTRIDAEVNLLLKDGNNIVKYDRISFRENVTIKLGDGEDNVSGIAAGFAKRLNMDLGDGDDTLTHASNIFASHVTINMGNGDDVYKETTSNFEQRWTADGGRGNDIIDRTGARFDRPIRHRNFEAGPESLIATQELSFDRQSYEINLDDTDAGATAEYSHNDISSDPQPVEYVIAGDDLSGREARRAARRRSRS